MPKKRKAKVKDKLMITVDDGTKDGLQEIIQNVPDIESRSAAIRWAVRLGVEHLKTQQPKPKPTQTLEMKGSS